MTTEQAQKTTLDYLHEIVRELHQQYSKYPAGEKIRYEVYLGEDDVEDDEKFTEYETRLEALNQLKEEGIVLDYVIAEKHEDFMHNEFAGTRIEYKIAKCLLDKDKFKQHLAELNPPREARKQIQELTEEEEKINKQTWEVLRSIREQFLVTPKGKPVKYRVPNVIGGGAIPKQRRIDILRKLEEQGAFEIKKGSNGARLTNQSRDAFYLIINQLRFDELYEEYRPKIPTGSAEKELDYKDNALRREYEKKWEVIKVVYSKFFAQDKPVQLLIPLEDFIFGIVKNFYDVVPYLNAFQAAGCWREHQTLKEEAGPFVFRDIDEKKLAETHLATKQNYERFSEQYEATHPKKRNEKNVVENQQTQVRPFCMIEGKWGFLKFGKYGEKVKIGGVAAQPFKLLRCLTEPSVGIAKTVDTVFEAIREGTKNKGKSGIYMNAIDKAQKVRAIEYAIKGVQKGNKLRGKLVFKWDDLKTKVWLEYLG